MTVRTVREAGGQKLRRGVRGVGARVRKPSGIGAAEAEASGGFCGARRGGEGGAGDGSASGRLDDIFSVTFRTGDHQSPKTVPIEVSR